MADLIDKTKAIDTVYTMSERCDTGDMNDLRDLIAEALRVLPSAQPEKVCVAEVKVEIDDIKDYIDKAINAERWIPCSERLPDTPDMVLVTIDWGDSDYEVSTDEYWSINGVATEGWGNLHGEVVTAWMPLPEPYKEDQE